MPESGPAVSASLRRRLIVSKHLAGETFPALTLVAATGAALVWANVGDSYNWFWHTQIGFSAGNFVLSMPLAEWVNEGLMAIFFFAVGLEVRREFALGELRHRSQAILPAAAAIGGLIIPALLYVAITTGSDAVSAWGVVISTDTAFALGVLALVGPKSAPRLRVFLLTLAVIDDIASLAVIAGVYTDDIHMPALMVAGLCLFAVWWLRRRGSWRATPYLIAGVLSWVAILESGVHATLAGVVLALLIPVYPAREQDVDGVSALARLYQQAPEAHSARLARMSLNYAVPLNQRLSELLPFYVNYLIVPVFALANAGVVLSADAMREAATSAITWGIVIGLVVGKLIGITIAAQLVTKSLPSTHAPGLDFPRMAGLAALSGMGFTISLLVVDLAFVDGATKDQARVGVLTSSVLAFLLAWLIFTIGDRMKPLPEPAGTTLQRAVQEDRDHMLGPADSLNTIVVYAALDDTYRKRTTHALKDLRARLGDKLTIVFRHHTYDIETTSAALALEAAAEQGAFWRMHDQLLTLDHQLRESDLTTLAERSSINANRFVHSVTTGSGMARVDDDNIDAATAALPQEPALYVNGRRFQKTPNSLNLLREILSSEGRTGD